MIRSKGVGVFFVTQQPTDLPAEVLGQLGARVQHALRAFTPEDADALKKTVRTYPTSEFYDLGKLLTEVGTGEAVVTILSEKGVPTPVVHTRLRAPRSSMTASSNVGAGREGIAAVREVRHAARDATAPPSSSRSASKRRRRRPRRPRRGKPKAAKPAGNALTDFLGSRQGKALQKEVVRGAFSLLRKRL